MPINTTIESLSQTPALNGPDGSVDPPSSLDDQQRYHGSFIAKLRDGVGFSANAINTAIGYTPVQRGGYAGQGSNPIRIGWNATISKLTVAVDENGFSNKWPIDVTGKADTAGTADNSNQLGGLAPIFYVRNTNTANTLGFRWDAGSNYLINSVDGNEFGGVWPIRIHWVNVVSRPTNVSAFANDVGYATLGTVNDNFVARRDDIYAAGRVGNSGRLLFGGGELQWSGFIVSDVKYKINIKPTKEDSLSKLRSVNWVEFDFIESAPLAGGTHRRLGFIAQQAQSVDQTYVKDIEGTLYPDNEMLLYAALHAVAQAGDKIAALEARVSELEAK